MDMKMPILYCIFCIHNGRSGHQAMCGHHVGHAEQTPQYGYPQQLLITERCQVCLWLQCGSGETPQASIMKPCKISLKKHAVASINELGT